MGFQGGILGSPLFCEGQSVVARNKQRALSQTIYTFPSMYGKPIYAIWSGDNVQVQTDRNRAFLVKNNCTISEL